MARATLVLLALLLAGCGGNDGDGAPPEAPAGRTLTGARAQAPASATAGTLSLVPDGPKARARLGYANLDALAAADLPVASDALVRRVLGSDAEARSGTAVRIGSAAERFDAGAPPQTSAITPAAVSAAQSCLGDTRAQTILGPGTMGADAAVGVGLADSGDAPAGLQLRICGAPRLVRHVHAMERALRRQVRRAARADRRAGDRRAGDRLRHGRRPRGPARGRSCACSPPARHCAGSPGAEPVSPAGNTDRRRAPPKCRPSESETMGDTEMTINRKAATGLLGATAAIAATGIAIGASTGQDRSAALAAKIDSSRPKNVILLVGDGMGDSEVTLARYYGKGAAGRLNMDRAGVPRQLHPLRAAPRPGPRVPAQLRRGLGADGDRVVDGQAHAGLAPLAGPVVGRQRPGLQRGLRTYMEIARDRGKATGNVSTAEITDATPAAPSAHISQRACQGPADTRTTCPTEAKTASPPGSARSPSSRSTRASTSTSAAGATATSRS